MGQDSLLSIYKLTLQYRGSAYHGWQVQPDQMTVQGCLNNALSKICKSSDVRSIGSGRTDAGVHAMEQIVRVELPFAIDPLKLPKAINSSLPRDIRVLKAQECSESFHPIRDAKEKVYRYYFTNEQEANPIFFDHIANYSFDLDMEQIEKALELIVGEHDFAAFQCEGTPVNSTIRTLFSASLNRMESESLHPTGTYYFEFRGNGFLKQMVRLLVGAMWHVGRGKVEIKDLSNALEGNWVKRLGPVAPAQGLYLHSVSY